MIKPYSESCEQNKQPILAIIAPLLVAHSDVLEIGSGTGQHAVYFAQKMPHLNWHSSDCRPYLDGIRLWLEQAALANTRPPLELDVSASNWPEITVDAIFTANTLHIMHQHDVDNLFRGTGKLLTKGGCLLIYGPFNYNRGYSSDSNACFDQWLKDRDPESGIKHFEDVEVLAQQTGLQLCKDYQMPANNRILHFIKT